MRNDNISVYLLLDKAKPGIYCHCGMVLEYEPLWVGQGRPVRPWESYWGMRKLGYECKIEVLYSNIDRSVAVEMEYQLIDLIGRRVDGSGPLLNKVRGRKAESPLQNKHKSERITRSNIARTGEVRSPEYRRKIGEATKRWMADPAKIEAMKLKLRQYHAKRRQVA